MARFAGIILAGGESRRFGSPKAFAKRNGIPFYHYSINALTPFCSSVILVTRPELHDQFKKEEEVLIRVINDEEKYKGKGPLAGIYSAMKEVTADWYFVLPIDVPFIEQWVLEELKNNLDSNVEAVVPVVAGKQQPLIAIYSHSVKNKIVDKLSNDKRSLRHLFETIHVKYVKMEKEAPFRNINRTEDL